MSAHDLATAIAAIDDEEVRAKVADGDLSAAGDVELTDEEQDLLQAAASGEADVVGVGITMSLGLGAGEVTVNKTTPTPTFDRAQVGHEDLPVAERFRPG